MNEPLITIDMQTGQQFNLPFIFHTGGDGRDTRVVGSPTDSRQEGGIGAWFHDLAGIMYRTLSVESL